jgi:hypothetical protein
MSTVAQRLLTAEEFMRLPEPPDGSRQELIRTCQAPALAGEYPPFRTAAP